MAVGRTTMGIACSTSRVSSFSTLLIFGYIALFLTYFNHFSTRLTYLMDAAYWVYLIHYSIVIVIPDLLAGRSILLIGIFLIVLISTTAICFISYHFSIRNSFVGMFLNGKVHKKQVG
jgi:glucan biosynthesis protein C